MSAGRKLRITPEARRWLEERGGEVTLRPSPRHGCCGGTAEVPVAEARRPARSAEYETIEIGSVRVHLAHALGLQGPMEVRLETLMGFGRLFVEAVGPQRAEAADQQESKDV